VRLLARGSESRGFCAAVIATLYFAQLKRSPIPFANLFRSDRCTGTLASVHPSAHRTRDKPSSESRICGLR
jgi:hypothetical protein